MGFNGDLMGFNGISTQWNNIPSGNLLLFAFENGDLLVSFPVKHGDFPKLCQFTRGYWRWIGK